MEMEGEQFCFEMGERTLVDIHVKTELSHSRVVCKMWWSYHNQSLMK